MKYQKSMLKIYEYLLNSPDRNLLTNVLKEAKVGRSAGYEAIEELASKRIIKIKKEGRQKYITLKINPTTLRFKLYLDELKLVSLPDDVRFAISLFVELASKSDPEIVLLVGSMASGTYTASSDIDFIIKTEDKKAIEEARNNTERVSQRVINTQFWTKNLDRKKLLKAVPLDGIDYYIQLVSEESSAKVDYEEALQWLASAERDLNKAGFRQSIDNSVRKLAFCYWKLEKEEVPSKQEARNLLAKHFKLKRTFKSKMNELKAVKRIAAKVGAKLYV